MPRFAFEDAIAELDNVAEDSHKDSTMIMQYRPSDLSLEQMIAAKVVHESILRVCVKWHSLCAPTHVVFTLGNAVTSALAQVFSKRDIHDIRSQHCSTSDEARNKYGQEVVPTVLC